MVVEAVVSSSWCEKLESSLGPVVYSNYTLYTVQHNTTTLFQEGKHMTDTQGTEKLVTLKININESYRAIDLIYI